MGNAKQLAQEIAVKYKNHLYFKLAAAAPCSGAGPGLQQGFGAAPGAVQGGHRGTWLRSHGALLLK